MMTGDDGGPHGGVRGGNAGRSERDGPVRGVQDQAEVSLSRAVEGRIRSGDAGEDGDDRDDGGQPLYSGFNPLQPSRYPEANA